ncbi:MAG: hypothetical protein AAF704_07090 [Cyanobacteria bacterium P01_D01_bin.123]
MPAFFRAFAVGIGTFVTVTCSGVGSTAGAAWGETLPDGDRPLATSVNQLRRASELTLRRAASKASNLTLPAPTQISEASDRNSAPHDSSEVEPESEAEPVDPDYKIPPQIVPNERVPPVLTILPLNGTAISHLTEWEVAPRYLFGEQIRDYLSIDGIYAIDSEVEQALTRDNVFISEQRGQYLQLRIVTTDREVEVAQSEPVTIVGMRVQESFTGTCRAVGKSVSDPNQQCTFTPALVVLEDSIDPDFLFPTRIEQPGNVGDVISPETLEILKQPGFQNEGVNGEVVGLDLFFPNVGSLPATDASRQARVERTERIKFSPALTFSRVRQVVKANHESAALGRTIHGFTGILGDRNFTTNAATQGVAQVFPDFVPDLEGSEQNVNTNINKTLFLAANNTRLPANSMTIYHGGIGRAKHQLPNQNAPSGRFRGVWLGLSPVVDLELFRDSRFENIGPSQAITDAGGEGGADANISFLSVVNDQTLSSDDISDFYAQVYLSFLGSDADSFASQILSESTTYYPHLSFTGNFTDLKQVFRYYAGAIASPKIKPYLGMDYTRSNRSGWRVKVGAIGYLNPDRDYFSKVDGLLSKQFALNRAVNVTLSSSFRYAINRPTGVEAILTDPANNFLAVGATFRFRQLSLGLTQFFDGVLEESTPSSLGGNISWNWSNRFTLSGYLLPQENLTSFGAILRHRFTDGPNGLSLSLQWNRDVYEFGDTLNTRDDRFIVQLRVGSPPNPFDNVVAPELREELEDEAELSVPRPGDPDYDETRTRP